MTSTTTRRLPPSSDDSKSSPPNADMMVDCSSPRCAHDRRLLKKELLSWTKKVPILLGLEQIAEAYVGKNVFKVLMEPFQALESTVVEDWEPSSECQYCLSNSTSEKDATDLDPDRDVTSSSPEMDGVSYNQQYLPLRYPTTCSLDGSTTDSNNKPLDLSASSHYMDENTTEHDSNSCQPLVELKVPQITNKMSKKKEFGSKRSYTEEDLSAAVSDIRSGKLGTRRAAALYGIPRSTLRNKIFRIESENSCERTPCATNLSMADLLQNMASQEMRKSELSTDDWEHRLDLLRRKHDLNAGLERPFGMPPLFFSSHNLLDCEKAFSMSNPYDCEAKMPFLHELVRRFAEHRMEAERNQCPGLPFSSELAQRLEPGQVNGGLGELGLGAGSLSSGTGGMVDLKIPSYKPIRSYMNGSAANGLADLAAASKNHSPQGSINGLAAASSKINDTLKNIISKTIAEKVRSQSQSLDGDMLASNALTNGYLKRELQSCSDLSIPQAKHFRRETRSSEKSLSGEGKQDDGSHQPQKKTRPKRGQYRKYNSQLLLEAVRAVQRGEMSVHRAGSYFGVPHSTLEYKVKERHLMRQKKPRESRSKKASSSSITSPNAANVAGTNSKSTSSESTSRQDSADDAEDFKCREEVASPEKSSTSTSSQSDSCHDITMMVNNTPHSAAQSRADSDLLTHSVNSLLSPQTPGIPIPGTHPLANFYMTGALPLGFGWPPLLGGTLPLGMPDPAMVACFPGYGTGSNINLSASDLLKKLQRKVEANTAKNSARKMSAVGTSHESGQPVQGNQSNSSQLTVT